MKIYGTAKAGALSKKNFGVAFGGGGVPAPSYPDGLGSSGDGSITGTSLDSTNKVNAFAESFEFNGSSDFCDLGNNFTGFIDNSSTYSFCLWIRGTVAQQSSPLSKDYTSHSSPYYSAGWRASTFGGGTLDQLTNNSGSAGGGLGTEIRYASPAINTWLLLVTTQTGTTQRFFVNNTEVSNAGFSSPISLHPNYYSTNWFLGKARNYSSFFGGQMQALAFWDIEISSGIRAELYNSGDGVDLDDLSTRDNIKAYYKLDSSSVDGSTLVNRAVP